MKASGALKRAGQALGIPHEEVNELSKVLRQYKSDDEEDYTDKDLEIAMLESIRDNSNTQLIDLAKRFVGILQSFGKHASCVVVSNQDIRKFCSTEYQKDSKTGEVIQVAACNFKHLEAMGLLKEDILGLRTVDVVDECLQMVDTPPDINTLPWTDNKTQELLQKGDTLGVFQMKSFGMIKTLKQVKPTGFVDLIHVVALYRPACILTGLLQEYIDRRNGKPFEYLDERLKDVLGETYGIMVFQEQIIKLVQVIAGYSMGEADVVRRAVGKKDLELMKQITAEFVEKAVNNGTKKEVAEEILGHIIASSSYSFSKGHSQSYAYLSWITAYLKAHYPVEFYVASINSEQGDQEKIIPFIQEIQRKGIELLPPDLRYSENHWIIEDGKIRIGLSYIKGIGSLDKPDEFTISTIYKMYNKRQLEGLVKSGALDFLGKRERMFAIINSYKQKFNEEEHCKERIIYFKNQLNELQSQPQDSKIDKKISTAKKKIDEWNNKLDNIKLVESNDFEYPSDQYEFDVFGTTIRDPLGKYDTSLSNGSTVIAGVVDKFESKRDKNDNIMANVVLHTGRRLVMFHRGYQELSVGTGYYFGLHNDIINSTRELHLIS